MPTAKIPAPQLTAAQVRKWANFHQVRLEEKQAERRANMVHGVGRSFLHYMKEQGLTRDQAGDEILRAHNVRKYGTPEEVRAILEEMGWVPKRGRKKAVAE